MVLDPFAGAGTTLAVAVEMGLHYIGYEIEKSYIRIAESRISLARTRLDVSGVLDQPGPLTHGRNDKTIADLFP